MARVESAGVAEKGKVYMNILSVLFWGAAWITASALLVTYNNYLMTPGKFPFSAGLGLLHSGSGSIFAGILYLVRPSWFPSLTDPAKKVDVASVPVMKPTLVIALCFCAQIIFSNSAMMFSDVAFLQMIKECNVVPVYLLSIALGQETLSWQQGRLLTLLMLATLLTIHGEFHLSIPGLMLQTGSLFAESLKIALQGYLLGQAGRRLDGFSYVLVQMPVCFIIFSITLTAAYFGLPADQQILPIPAWSDWAGCAALLVPNCLLAFSLNIIMGIFVNKTSAIGLVMAGITKDVVIVLFGVMFLGHVCGRMQTTGFTLQALIVVTWSLMKKFPKEFAHGEIRGLLTLFSLGSSVSESTPTKPAV